MDRFAADYESGLTPNPCIDCNRYLKFDRLFQRARKLGCETVVTGHYARIEKRNGRYVLRKALDESKDQSYVLYMLTQEQLAHVHFPLGAMTKEAVRKLADEMNWIAMDSLTTPLRVKSKIRYRQTEQPATVYPEEGGQARIVFDAPQRAITPGQTVVLYDGDAVVGGGRIRAGK